MSLYHTTGEGWEDEFTHSPLGGTTEENGAGINVGSAAPVWCLACHDNLIVAGCGDGAVEVRKPLFLQFFYQIRTSSFYSL